MKKLFKIIAATICIASSAYPSYAQERDLAQEAANKKFVREFFYVLYNDKNIEKARTMMDSNMINHHPHGGNGADGTLRALKQHLFGRFPDFKVEIKRMAAEGDLVWIQCYTKNDAKEHGKMSMDIFRVKNGKIAEHWDIIQDVPADVEPSEMFN
jgi:predicted SnoaL-like aldol condensation-catalyzing enzyme